MRLGLIVEGTNPLRIFNEETGAVKRVFGLHGHEPLSFRTTGDFEAEILLRGTRLGRISMGIEYENEERYWAFSLKDPLATLPQAARQRVESAGIAFFRKVAQAVQSRELRVDRLNAHIYETIGPADSAGAIIALGEDAKTRLKAFCFPGIAQRVLPPNFYVSNTEKKGHLLTLAMHARDPDGIIDAPAFRIQTQGETVWACGRGNREKARVNFVETILDAAQAACAQKAQDPLFHQDLQKIIGQKKDVLDRVLADPTAPGLVRGWLIPKVGLPNINADAFLDPDMTKETHNKGQAQDFPVPDSGFVYRKTSGPKAISQILHQGQVIYDLRAGCISGIEPRFAHDYFPCITLAALSEHPNMRGFEAVRFALAQTEPEKDPENEILLAMEERRADPDVEFFL